MLGEKKSEIFDLIPKEFIPKTKLIRKGDINEAKAFAQSTGYPLIAKPDVGERGTWVSKIDSPEELEKYVSACPVDFLIQELVEYPIELGVFYIKYPDEENGRVTSIIRKDFLRVKGDGKSSVMELLRMNTRAQLTADLESDFLRQNGDLIPEKGQELTVEPIGNHCRGTQFLNDNEFIDEELSKAFDKLSKQIPEFYFGRYDLKCNSYEDLKELKNFKILELNGAGAEPGHIYQPGYSLIQAYKDIFWHLRVLADISRQNKKRGVPYWSFSRGYKKWKEHRQYNRMLSA